MSLARGASRRDRVLGAILGFSCGLVILALIHCVVKCW